MISFTNIHAINDRKIQFDYTRFEENMYNVNVKEITNNNECVLTKHNVIINLDEENIQNTLQDIISELMLKDTNKNNIEYFTSLLVFNFMDSNDMKILNKEHMDYERNNLVSEYNSLFYFLNALIDVLKYEERELSVSMSVCLFNVISLIEKYNKTRKKNFEILLNSYEKMNKNPNDVFSGPNSGKDI